MQAYLTFPPPSNIVPIVPRPARRAGNLLAEIRRELRTTKDGEREAELLSLGIEILRQRQGLQRRAGR